MEGGENSAPAVAAEAPEHAHTPARAPEASAGPASAGLVARQLQMMPARGGGVGDEDKAQLRRWIEDKLQGAPENTLPSSLLSSAMTVDQRRVWNAAGHARGLNLHSRGSNVYLHAPPEPPPAPEPAEEGPSGPSEARSTRKPKKEKPKAPEVTGAPAEQPAAEQKKGKKKPKDKGAAGAAAAEPASATPAQQGGEQTGGKGKQKVKQPVLAQGSGQLGLQSLSAASKEEKMDAVCKLLLHILPQRGGIVTIRELEAEFRQPGLETIYTAWRDVDREQGLIAHFPDLFCVEGTKFALVNRGGPGSAASASGSAASGQRPASATGPRPASASGSQQTPKASSSQQVQGRAAPGAKQGSHGASISSMKPAQEPQQQQPVPAALQEVVSNLLAAARTAAASNNMSEAMKALLEAIKKAPRQLQDQVWESTQVASKMLGEKLKGRDLAISEQALLQYERLADAIRQGPFGKEGRQAAQAIENKIKEYHKRKDLAVFQNMINSLDKDDLTPAQQAEIVSKLRERTENRKRSFINKLTALSMTRVLQKVIDMLKAAGVHSQASGRNTLREMCALLKMFSTRLSKKNEGLQVVLTKLVKEVEGILSVLPELSLDAEGLEKLSSQIKKSYDEQRQTNAEKKAVDALVKQVEDAARQSFQQEGVLQVLPFGSAVSGFALKSSDVDICIELYNTISQSNPRQPYYRLASILRRYDIEVLETVAHARVPIIKIKSNGLCADLCINNVLGTHNSALLQEYSSLDKRVGQVGLAVKRWAKSQDLNCPMLQSLSSYGYMLLVVSYLQRCQPAVLPNLQANIAKAPRAEVEQYTVGEYKCWYEELKGWKSENSMSTAELLVGFFREYGYNFNYEKNAVSIRLGAVVPKSALPKKVPFKPWRLCIEDPFENDTDCARMLSEWNQERMIEAMQSAHDLLCSGVSFDTICQKVVVRTAPQEEGELEGEGEGEGEGPT